MNWNKQKYNDRFGNEWSVRVKGASGKPRRVSFTCKEFQLIAVEDETADSTDVTLERLKEVFCDAERIIEHKGETWHVGFHKRTGRGGQNQGGLHTRFRSESGETRYAKGMLHFRHMPGAALCEHLDAATPVARASRP